MIIQSFAKLAGVLAVTALLSGCIDATAEIEVLSETTAKLTFTQVMDKSVYEMMQAEADPAAPGALPEDFCDEGKVSVSGEEATCTISKEGPFAELTLAEDGGETISITTAGPGLVRVGFPTADMKGELGVDETLDAQSKAMMVSFFEGREITVKVSGGEIVETNMDLAADKRSAEKVIPFLDLINGEVELPDELFAVVRK